MARLDFSSFRNLLADVDKIDLYDAIKPELQAYAAHRSSGLPIDQTYSLILEQSYLASGGEKPVPAIGDPIELVRRMGKGRDGRGKNYGTARVHVERVYYFFLFSDDSDPTAYGERISRQLFGQSFFDRFARELRALDVERPNHLPHVSRVKLGSVEISLGAERDLLPFRMEQHERPNLIDEEGRPAVYVAMHWRSGLSQLHGRVEEYNKLVEWALDDSKLVKTMLISGPGGAGKTRLAAEVVRNLVNKRKWNGGFLLDGYDKSQGVYDGNGAGVVFVIDYPEENTEAVREIIASAGNAIKYSRPIRIILVSRENKADWLRILNKIELGRFEETPLDLTHCVSREDALEIASDIETHYPNLIGKPKAAFAGVGEWLDRHATHRLPLNVVAASIHAVLDPTHAFKLDSAEVSTALAEWELRRVRYYSTRDLGDRDCLEKLLGLSLFTPFGLTKETVFELSEKGICKGRSGDGLLDAVRRTPYWRPKSTAQPSHLARLAPDRPAAIFCLKALRLGDPSPSLPTWLAPCASQEVDGFGDRLSRLAFDVGHVDPEASRILEKQSIAMLDRQPTLVNRFYGIAFRRPSVFSAAFAAEVCRRLIEVAPDNETRVALLNNQAEIFLGLGRSEAALEVIDEAVAIRRQLALARPDDFLPNLAGSLNTRANILSQLGRRDAALDTVEEALAIHRQLQHEQPDVFLPDFAMSLNNRANILSDLGRTEVALDAITMAVATRRKLARARPSFLSDLAMSLNNMAAVLLEVGRWEPALNTVEEAVAIYRQLRQSRPDAFLPDFAVSLNTRANILSNLGRSEAALDAIDEAVTLDRQLAQTRPEAFLPDLASMLNNRANILSKLGQREAALATSAEAVAVLRPFFLDFPLAHEASMRTIVRVYVNLCRADSTETDALLLGPIVETFQRIAQSR